MVLNLVKSIFCNIKGKYFKTLQNTDGAKKYNVAKKIGSPAQGFEDRTFGSNCTRISYAIPAIDNIRF